MEQNPGVLSNGPKLLVCFSGSLNGRAFSIISRKEDYLRSYTQFFATISQCRAKSGNKG